MGMVSRENKEWMFVNLQITYSKGCFILTLSLETEYKHYDQREREKGREISVLNPQRIMLGVGTFLYVTSMYLEFGLILTFSHFGLISRHSCIKSQRSDLIQVRQVFLGGSLWGQLQTTVCSSADCRWNIFWAPRGAGRRSIYESNSACWWETKAKRSILFCPSTTSSYVEYSNKELLWLLLHTTNDLGELCINVENIDKLSSLLPGINESNRWTGEILAVLEIKIQ